MNFKYVTATLLVAMGLAAARVASAQSASSNGTNAHPPIIYVMAFQATDAAAPSSTHVLARLRAARDARQIADNSTALADAIVANLKKKGVVAYRLTPQQTLPTSGWLVSGTYEQKISHSLFPMLSSLASSGTPNTDAAIRVSDLSAQGKRFTAFDTSATLKGQGHPVSLNPYVMAAHVAVNHVEATSSMNTLADAVTEQILIAEQASQHSVALVTTTNGNR